MTYPELWMMSLQTCRHQSSLPARHWKSTEQDLQITMCANTVNEYASEGTFSSFLVPFHAMKFHRAEHHPSCLQGLRDSITVKWEKDTYLPSHSTQPWNLSLPAFWMLQPMQKAGASSCCFPNPWSPYSWQSLPKRLSNTVVGHGGLGVGEGRQIQLFFLQEIS